MDVFNQNWQDRIKNDQLTRTYLTGDGKEYVKVRHMITRITQRGVRRRNRTFDREKWEQIVRHTGEPRSRFRSNDGNWMKLDDLESHKTYYNTRNVEEAYPENRSSYSRVNSLYNLNYATLR